MIRAIPFLLLLAPLSAMEILGVDYSESDKQSHAVLGAASAAIAMLAADRVDAEYPWYVRAGIGMAAATFIGVFKELSDANRDGHTAERDDAVATITGGVVVAFTLCWEF